MRSPQTFSDILASGFREAVVILSRDLKVVGANDTFLTENNLNIDDIQGKTCHDVLAIDGKALIICGDSTHRFGVDIFADECRKVGLLVTVTKIDRRELISSSQNLESTSGYVEGMLLNFFTLTKNRVTQI